MSAICPYCKEPFKGHVPLPPMRPRKMRIYNAVARAGHDGITKEDLLVRMYDENEWPTPGGPQVLRVMICEINKVIGMEPYRQRITANVRKRYRLIGLQQVDRKDEEALTQEGTTEDSQEPRQNTRAE